MVASNKNGSRPHEATCGHPAAPDLWLYASRKLELLHLPGAAAGPYVAQGGTIYFRIDPEAVAYLRAAGDALATRNPPPDQLAEYARAMSGVEAFALAKWTVEELDAAFPQLPTVEQVPAL